MTEPAPLWQPTSVNHQEWSLLNGQNVGQYVFGDKIYTAWCHFRREANDHVKFFIKDGEQIIACISSTYVKYTEEGEEFIQLVSNHWAKDYDPRGFANFNQATLVRYMPIVDSIELVNDDLIPYPNPNDDNHVNQEELEEWEDLL